MLNTFKEYFMRLVNEAYEKGDSPILLQGYIISNELPQIKEMHILQIEEWRSALTRFIQETKSEGIVGNPYLIGKENWDTK